MVFVTKLLPYSVGTVQIVVFRLCRLIENIPHVGCTEE